MAGMFPGPPGEIDRWAETRLLRQQVLIRDPPLELSVIIEESVLSRRFGDRAVMRQQLEHLVAAAELPNVEVRIYPLNGEHPSLATGAFSYMQFPQVHDVPLHDIVSVEHLEGTADLEDEELTYIYRAAFEYLRAGPTTQIDHAHSYPPRQPNSGHKEPGPGALGGRPGRWSFRWGGRRSSVR